MKKTFAMLFAAFCASATVLLSVVPVLAQSSDVKEKAPLYSYVGFWVEPRSQWADMDKSQAADEKILQAALANGTIVAYGWDTTIVHQPDGPTQDDWFSAMSQAGLFNTLDQFYKSGSTTTPVLNAASKHWDGVYVSRYYNWHPGSWKGLYTRSAAYKLKPDAPEGTLDLLSKTIIAPILEKLLADGAIHEYEIDTEAIHTESPGMFYIVYIAANAEGLDKVDAAVESALKANPMMGPTFSSATDMSAHRDTVTRTTANYK